MATPSLAMIPSAYADSKVYSVLPNNGDGDFSFNRDSSATRIGQNGLIQTVGYFGNDIVLNGDFSNGSTNWALNSNWSVANNKATADGTSNSIMFQSNVLQDNTLYLVSYTLSNFTQGSININLSGVSGVTRTTNGTYTEYVTSGASPSGRLDIQGSGSFIVSITNISVKEVTGDQPRLNYDISNGVVQSCPSLLLEGASTNLITYSEDFSNAYWNKSGVSVVGGFTSPDGTTNAFKLVENTATTTHQVLRSFSYSNAKYSLSAFLKADGRNWIKINLYDGTSSVYAYFDLTNGVVGQELGASGKIENYGNGWYRCSMSSTSNVSSGNGNISFRLAEFDGGAGYTGNGTSGLYIFGAQLEALSYATSYIPTNGSSQTRAAETCFGAGTASTFNSTEGVLYFEGSALTENSGDSRRITISDGNANNKVMFELDETEGLIKLFLIGGGNVNLLSTTTNVSANFKIAASYQSSSLKLYLNGLKIAEDPTVSLPTGLNDLSFNSGQNGNPFYGNCKDIRVFNEALTDLQLQKLTTL